MSDRVRRLAGLQERRIDFLALRDEARARLQVIEERFVDTLLAGEPVDRGVLVDARTQLAIAEADLAMVDRILDRWQLVH